MDINSYKDKIVASGITFDDVALVPAESQILPADVSTTTFLTKNISLNIPIVSAAMDTVTESRMAIALAQEGGIGIIHRNMSIEQEVLEVTKVKRSANGVILNPITLPPDANVKTAKEIMRNYNISGIPIVRDGKVVGILTARDLKFGIGDETRVADVMTKDRLVVAAPGTTLKEAKEILQKEKVEKLLLVEDGELKGLITMKDIDKLSEYPNATRDKLGRLVVGAAIGVFDFERAEKLCKAGVDVLVLDTAHGHSKNVYETLVELKKNFEIEVIAGNVATADGAEYLIRAGADAIKVGIGSGSICTTRVIAGAGVPQITAVLECARVAKKYGVFTISDGGVRYSGDITKAIAAGADSVMLGNLLASVEESPGEIVYYQGKACKSYRGMGSVGAMIHGSKDRYFQGNVNVKEKLVPEGIEGVVPYRGKLSEFLYQLVGGLRAGMGYVGAKNIKELQEKSKFILVSFSSIKEAHPHDVTITKESPNYWIR